MGYRHLSLREALASDRLEDFVRQAEARGVELTSGSDLERALALLITHQTLNHHALHFALVRRTLRREPFARTKPATLASARMPCGGCLRALSALGITSSTLYRHVHPLESAASRLISRDEARLRKCRSLSPMRL
jgi:hypothetical protein